MRPPCPHPLHHQDRPTAVVLGLTVCLIGSLLSGSAAAQCQMAQLKLAGPTTDGLGKAVAIDGVYALIGAPDPSIFDATGTVHAFEEMPWGWQETQALKPVTPIPNDRFGAALDSESGRAIVGAPGRSSPAVDGAAYIFERSGFTWSQMARLEPAQVAARDAFGTSVSIFGERVLVGAPGNQQTGPGRAFVFERDPLTGAWTEAAELLPASGQAFDGFGTAVALGDDLAVVGAPYGESPGIGPAQTGSVHVFEFSAGSWQELATLSPPNGKPGGGFGRAVDLDDQHLAVGAPFHTEQGAPHGAVYIFRSAAGGWGIESIPSIAIGLSATALGSSVSIAGDQLLCGDPGAAVQGLPGAGRVHRFRHTGSIWLHVGVLQPVNPGPLGGFGASLDQDAENVLTGSGDPLGPGTVRVFSTSLNDCPALAADVNGISLATGGTQELSLSAGPANAGRLYLVLGTASGTTPGILFDGLVLPLNPDAYLQYRLLSPPLPPISGALGLLNVQGSGSAQVQFPAGSASTLTGLTLHHAFIVLDTLGSGAVSFISNAVALGLGP